MADDMTHVMVMVSTSQVNDGAELEGEFRQKRQAPYGQTTGGPVTTGAPVVTYGAITTAGPASTPNPTTGPVTSAAPPVITTAQGGYPTPGTPGQQPATAATPAPPNPITTPAPQPKCRKKRI